MPHVDNLNKMTLAGFTQSDWHLVSREGHCDFSPKTECLIFLQSCIPSLIGPNPFTCRLLRSFPSPPFLFFKLWPNYQYVAILPSVSSSFYTKKAWWNHQIQTGQSCEKWSPLSNKQRIEIKTLSLSWENKSIWILQKHSRKLCGMVMITVGVPASSKSHRIIMMSRSIFQQTSNPSSH